MYCFNHFGLQITIVLILLKLKKKTKQGAKGKLFEMIGIFKHILCSSHEKHVMNMSQLKPHSIDAILK